MEARHRSGGRVHTTRLWGAPPADGSENTVYGVGEQGGSVITGADGNPLAVVARQLGAQLHTIRDRCGLLARALLLLLSGTRLTMLAAVGAQVSHLRAGRLARAGGHGQKGAARRARTLAARCRTL